MSKNCTILVLPDRTIASWVPECSTKATTLLAVVIAEGTSSLCVSFSPLQPRWTFLGTRNYHAFSFLLVAALRLHWYVPCQGQVV